MSDFHCGLSVKVTRGFMLQRKRRKLKSFHIFLDQKTTNSSLLLFRLGFLLQTTSVLFLEIFVRLGAVPGRLAPYYVRPE